MTSHPSSVNSNGAGSSGEDRRSSGCLPAPATTGQTQGLHFEVTAGAGLERGASWKVKVQVGLWGHGAAQSMRRGPQAALGRGVGEAALTPIPGGGGRPQQERRLHAPLAALPQPAGP